MYSDQNICLRPCPSKGSLDSPGLGSWTLVRSHSSEVEWSCNPLTPDIISSQQQPAMSSWNQILVCHCCGYKVNFIPVFLHGNLHHCCCTGNVGSTILIPLKFALIGFKWRQNLISMGVVSGYAKMSSSYGGRYQNLAYLTFFSTLSTYSIFVPTMKHNLRYIYWKITKCTELDENKLKIDP